MFRTLILLLLMLSPLGIFADNNKDPEIPFVPKAVHVNEFEFVDFLRRFCQRYEQQFPEKERKAQKKYKKALKLNYSSEELKRIILEDCNCHPNEAMYQKYAPDVLEAALCHHKNEFKCAQAQMLTVLQKLKDVTCKEIYEFEDQEESVGDYQEIIRQTSDDKAHAQDELARILTRAQLRYTLRQQAQRCAYHRHAMKALDYSIDQINPSRWTFFNPVSWLFG